MTDRYAVFGNPIEHSLSPQIHTAFAAQTGEDIDYQRKLVAPQEFASSVQQFFASGGSGLNITLPFKLEAYLLCEKLTSRADRAGAVNTLYLENNVLVGDNTDGQGLCSDLTSNLGWQIADSRVLLLGAGGAVRGVLLPLLACRPAQVIIANRTVGKAEELAAQFNAEASKQKVELHAQGFEQLRQSFDLVINGTSASLGGELPPVPQRAVDGARCYDMMYAAQPTAFLKWAAANGARSLADGLGMLVEQAAEAFFVWRGRRPDSAPVIEQIRASL